jgi:hypothetical protein
MKLRFNIVQILKGKYVESFNKCCKTVNRLRSYVIMYLLSKNLEFIQIPRGISLHFLMKISSNVLRSIYLFSFLNHQ